MGRRSSFIGIMNQVAREASRAQKAIEASQRRSIREQIQNEKAAARDAKLLYLEERSREAEEQTEELNERIMEFNNILLKTLSIDDTILFDSLRSLDVFPDFKPDPSIAKAIICPNEEQFTSKISPPNFISKLLPGSAERYAKALEKARDDYEEAVNKCKSMENVRIAAFEKALKKHTLAKQAFDEDVQKKNNEIDQFEVAYHTGDPEAISAYSTMVLERSEYPDEFPQEFRLAYIPESKQVVIDYELPSPEVIPKVSEYRYVKSKDSIEEKARKPAEIRDLYQDMIAAIALRTCHELFESDQGNHLESIVFNGFTQTIDPSTGKDARPFLISVRTTKARFLEIDLARIDKRACLRNLGAQVSPRPYEVQPVKPIVEFDMVDKRFVQESDILSDLESRPNLMDLNPFEFENLVSNLFKQMGLDSKLTRSSRDGGVDVVAFDTRPIVGGKVVIQAKRYKNTVGVSAVRDLYGTMMNEGANKGILVTTSGYGPDAFDFAKDKPIELIDGGGLLYLLENAGIKARIVFPDDWSD